MLIKFTDQVQPQQYQLQSILNKKVLYVFPWRLVQKRTFRIKSSIVHQHPFGSLKVNMVHSIVQLIGLLDLYLSSRFNRITIKEKKVRANNLCSWKVELQQRRKINEGNIVLILTKCLGRTLIRMKSYKIFFFVVLLCSSFIFMIKGLTK